MGDGFGVDEVGGFEDVAEFVEAEAEDEFGFGVHEFFGGAGECGGGFAGVGGELCGANGEPGDFGLDAVGDFTGHEADGGELFEAGVLVGHGEGFVCEADGGVLDGLEGFEGVECAGGKVVAVFCGEFKGAFGGLGLYPAADGALEVEVFAREGLGHFRVEGAYPIGTGFGGVVVEDRGVAGEASEGGDGLAILVAALEYAEIADEFVGFGVVDGPVAADGFGPGEGGGLALGCSLGDLGGSGFDHGVHVFGVAARGGFVGAVDADGVGAAVGVGGAYNDAFGGDVCCLGELAGPCTNLLDGVVLGADGVEDDEGDGSLAVIEDDGLGIEVVVDTGTGASFAVATEVYAVFRVDGCGGGADFEFGSGAEA